MKLDLTVDEVTRLKNILEFFSLRFELIGVDAEVVPSVISKLEYILSQ